MTATGSTPPVGARGAHEPVRVLGDALDTRDNALNLVRLVLALAVIFGHAFPLGGFPGFQAGPFVHAGLHGLAVHAFFAISGYLILASGLRLPTGIYLWRRFLRIYPGFLVAVLMTAFVFAPLGGLLEPGARWEVTSAAQYVFGALDLKPSQEGVERTLVAVPWPETWNGSLWTLFYEAAAYLGIAVLVGLPLVRRALPVIVPIAAVAGTLVAAFADLSALVSPLPAALADVLVTGIGLWVPFLWGMLAFQWRDRLPARPLVVAVAALAFLVLAHLAVGGILADLIAVVRTPLLAYTVLGAGAVLRSRIGQTNDLSYGMYVYAFPVQQILILLGVQQLGWFLTAALCALATLPFAALSWVLIEKPALALGARRRPTGQG